MTHPKLKVLPQGNVMVPRFESILAGAKQFIGRVWSDKHGPGGGWEPSADPVEVPSIPESSPDYLELWQEYAREIRDGALWPADAATAKAAGVKFDPSFGGEFAASTSTKADSAAEPSLHVSASDAEPTHGA